MAGRGKRAVAVAVAALLSFGFSGCFWFSSLNWSPLTVKPGKSTTAKIRVTSDTSGIADDRTVQFFLFGFDNTGYLSLGGKRTWDVKGLFKGPQHMIVDGTLRNQALQSDYCAFGGSGGAKLNTLTDVVWTAVRTENRINDRDRDGTVALSEIKVKAAENGSGQRNVWIFAGGWDDEEGGDGQPQPDEVGCSGGTLTTLTISD
jgi:hypothetical protein